MKGFRFFFNLLSVFLWIDFVRAFGLTTTCWAAAFQPALLPPNTNQYFWPQVQPTNTTFGSKYYTPKLLLPQVLQEVTRTSAYKYHQVLLSSSANQNSCLPVVTSNMAGAVVSCTFASLWVHICIIYVHIRIYMLFCTLPFSIQHCNGTNPAVCNDGDHLQQLPNTSTCTRTVHAIDCPPAGWTTWPY